MHEEGLAIQCQEGRQKPLLPRLALHLTTAACGEQREQRRSQRIHQGCCGCGSRGRGGKIHSQAGQAAAAEVSNKQLAARITAAKLRHDARREAQQHGHLARGQLAHRGRQRGLQLAAAQHRRRRCLCRLGAAAALQQRGRERLQQNCQLAQLGESCHQAAGHRRGYAAVGAGAGCRGPQQQGPQQGQLPLNHSVLDFKDTLHHAQRGWRHAARRACCLRLGLLRQRQRPVCQQLQQRALLAGRVLSGAVQLLRSQGPRQERHAAACRSQGRHVM